MYKKYNINELIQTFKAMLREHTENNLGEEIGLLAVMGEIGFDLRDVGDFAEWCNLKIYDSKKFNEDFTYKNGVEKTQFKKYLRKKIDKLSGILERIEPVKPTGRIREENRNCKNIEPKVVDITARSNEEISTALRRVIDHFNIDIEAIGNLVSGGEDIIKGYIAGRYEYPTITFIEEISNVLGIDPRYFMEYRKYLRKDIKEDRPTPFGLPDQSDEDFNISLKKIVDASGIKLTDFFTKMQISSRTYYELISGNMKPKVRFIKKVADCFNIDLRYFKEYRGNKEAYKEDRTITLENYRITKKIKEIYELPDKSEKSFGESLERLIGASGITIQILLKNLHCSSPLFYKYYREREKPKMKFITKVAEFFDIDPCYFAEYRENEIIEKHLTKIIKQREDTII